MVEIRDPNEKKTTIKAVRFGEVLMYGYTFSAFVFYFWENFVGVIGENYSLVGS